MTTDTSEKGLETLIMRHMTGVDGFAVASGAAAQNPELTGTGYLASSPKDFDRAHALEHIPPASNRGDSQRWVDKRVWRP